MTSSATFMRLPIDQLYESPENPRKRFDPVAMAELVASVSRQGVLTPILVRPLPGEPLRYEIAAGHRRVRAATTAAIPDVPALVKVMKDEEFLETLIVENGQREDIHELEEAEGYETLMQRAGYDAESLAAKVGKSLSYIYQRLKLLALIPEARKRFLAGEITAGHAVPLARLTAADQKTALEYLTHRDPWEKHDVGPPSVQAFRAWIGQELILDLKKAPFDTTDVVLVAKAGACGPCPKRSGAQPALFADLASRDLCTDRTCHAAKVAAHIASTTKTLEAKGETVKRLSTNHHLDPEERKGKTQPLTAYEWRKAGAITCDKTVTGIVVSGYQERDDGIGKTFRVCINPKCKTHAGHRTIDRPASKPKTAAERRAERDAQDAEQVERLTLANLNDAIIAHATAVADEHAVPGGLVDLLRVMACGLVREMWHDTIRDVARRRGWLPPKGADRGGDNPLTTRFCVEIGEMETAPLLGLWNWTARSRP